MDRKDEIITKRVFFDKDTYKEFRKFLIDEELDINGKITPEMLGEAIKRLLKCKKEKKFIYPEFNNQNKTNNA